MTNSEKPRETYFTDVLYVMFKRKAFVLSVVGLVMLGVVGGILLAKQQYEASAMLIVKRDRSELVVTPTPVAGGSVNLKVNLDQDLNSEAELVKRRSLLVQVVQTVGADSLVKGRFAAAPGTQASDEGPATLALQYVKEAFGFARPVLAVPAHIRGWVSPPVQQTDLDQALRVFDTNLAVTPVLDSNLIKVSFIADDSRLAGAVLDTLLKSYLERYAQTRTSPGITDFFERQVAKLGGELKTAEDQLREFDQRQGIVSVDRQRDLYLTTGTQQEVALQLARSAVEELKAKSRELKAKLEKMPERIAVSEEVRRSPVRDAIAAKLLDFETQRNQVLQKYLETDRHVTDMDKEVNFLRDKFLSEKEWEVGRTTYGENPARNPLVIELVQTESELLRSQVRVAYLERDTKDFSDRVRHIDAMAFERARQERSIKMLEDAYLLYAKKTEEARISGALDRDRIVNVALVEPVQVTPKRGVGGRAPLQLVALGLIVGVVSGVGGAFCREYMSHSFTTDESVRRHLDLPVLGSIPDNGKEPNGKANGTHTDGKA